MYYIVIDLDATVLNNQGQNSEYTLKVFRMCQKNNCQIIINTMRSYINSKDIIKILRPKYSVLFSGNLIIDHFGNVIYQNPINHLYLDDIIDCFKGKVNNITIETLNYCYSDDLNYRQKLGKVLKLDLNKRQYIKDLPFKIQVNTDNPSVLYRIPSVYNIEVSQYFDTQWYRILPSTSDKWNGIQKIIELDQISNEKMIAFGDDITDILTLQNCGVGVAMSNSRAQVLKLINKTTPSSNDQDGVAKFLVNYFKLDII